MGIRSVGSARANCDDDVLEGSKDRAAHDLSLFEKGVNAFTICLEYIAMRAPRITRIPIPMIYARYRRIAAKQKSRWSVHE